MTTIVYFMPSIDPSRLAAAMSATGVSTAELGRRCGISTSYSARIVNGTSRLKRNPALRRKIALALSVPIDWIEARESTGTAA